MDTQPISASVQNAPLPSSGNPVWDEIANKHASLSPQAKQAIELSGVMAKQAPAIVPQDPTHDLPDAPMPGAIPIPKDNALANLPPVTPGAIGVPVGMSATPKPAQHIPIPEDPRLQQAKDRYSNIMQTGPGVSQIHHAGIRIPLQILDAIGSGLFPNIAMGIPGTTAHHQLLMNGAANNLGNLEDQQNAAVKRAGEEANRFKTEGEVAEQPTKHDLDVANTGHIQAETNALNNPATDPYQDFKQQNPHASVKDWLELQSSSKEKPVKGDLKAMHADAVAQALEKGIDPKDDPTVQRLTDSILSLQKESKEPKQTLEEQAVSEYRAAHPKATLQEAREKTKIVAPEHPPQALMIGPDGQAIAVRPGTVVPQGAQTPSGVNSVNTPTTQMKNVVAQAGLVHEQTPMMLAEIDRLKDKLGPVMGRWNEFMQGKIGTDDPEMAGLRTDLLMHSSAVALMHARVRLPENLRKEFDDAINAPKQTAGNLKSVLTHIDDWTVKNMKTMGGRENGGTGGGDPKQGDTRDYQGHTFKFDGNEWVKQ